MATPQSARPGRPRDPAIRHRRQEEILDAAARLFAARGFPDADTQELADTLGVGKGTIYRYFASKRELFLAAVDRVMRQATAAIDAALDGVEEPFARMLRGTQAYLAFFAARPEYVELIVQERAHFKDRQKPTYFIHRDANIERWRELVRSLVAGGRLRDLPAERITDVLGDMLYGTMFTNYFVGRHRSPEEQAKELLDIAWNGILSEPERGRQRRLAAGAAAAPPRGNPAPAPTPGGTRRKRAVRHRKAHHA